MRIRLVSPAALVLLGSLNLHVPASAQPMTITHLAGGDGGNDSVDGSRDAARFNDPRGIALDAQGNLFVADSLNHTIRRVTPQGEVSTLAGMPGLAGYADGAASEARFNHPWGVAVDGAGNVFVADSGNHTIRVVTRLGRVSTVAGLAGVEGGDDGRGSTARFARPFALAADRDGTLWVVEYDGCSIRRVSREGDVSTLAGRSGAMGFVDGTGGEARFSFPTAIALEASGSLLVADGNNYAIRRVTRDGNVTTVVGPEDAGFSPGVATDPAGNVYILDRGYEIVKKLTPAGEMTVLAGLRTAPFSTGGSRDGHGPDARFNSPWAITADAAGTLYVADTGNHLVRKVTPTGDVSTLAGLVGAYGYADGPAREARFYFPRQIAADRSGNVYVADSGNHVVRRVSPDGTVTTLAGRPGQSGSADGVGGAARFQLPAGVALDPLGNVLVADAGNQTIRRIAPDGKVTTVAGTAGAYAGADGVGAEARFFSPLGVACDAHGNVFVADTGNATIRKIDSHGRVTTLAGAAGQHGSADGPGVSARFDTPYAVAVDARGSVFATDHFSGTIRKIDPDGRVTTLAGQALAWDHVDGPGDAARFYFPAGIAIDASGTLWVADAWNQSIRKVTPDGVVSTVAGPDGSSVSAVCQAYPVEAGRSDGCAKSARFSSPEGVAVGPDGSLYVADTQNHALRVAPPLPLPAVATIDVAAGAFFTHPALDGGNALDWQWTVRRRPAGSGAELSDSGTRQPGFAPDRPGVYVIGLVARGSGASSVSEVRYEALERQPAREGPPLIPAKRVPRN